MFHLDATNLSALEDYLDNQPGNNQKVITSAEKPGEGNMNYVLRIHTGMESFIIKQARPYVEKYPSIPAPVERAKVEAAFYQTIQSDKILKSYTPSLLWTDNDNHITALEDLGEANDYSDLYKLQRQLEINEVKNLVEFINRLHTIKNTHDPVFQNRKMRELNHQHIFLFPFMEDNGFNLDTIQPGLQALAMTYKTDRALKDIIVGLGDTYLQDGDTLLHGDYYPGSWLNTVNGIKIIDPEFCFYGPAVFDLAVMSAHCMLTQQDQRILDTILSTYQGAGNFDKLLYDQFTGVEIMRRLIGLAQVPLVMKLEAKQALLKQAVHLLQN